MTDTKSMKSLLLKTLFIVGIFIVVVVLAFALVKIIPMIFSSFTNVGNVFRHENNTLGIEVEKTKVDSGELVFVKWDYEPTEAGIYEIQYSCAENLSFEIGTTEGNRDIKCNTVYHLNPTTRSVSLLPTLDRENILVESNFKINYIGRSGEILSGDEVKFTIVRRAAADLAGSGSIVETELINTGTVNIDRGTERTSVEPTSTNGTMGSGVVTNTPSQVQPSVRLADFRIYDVYTTDDTTIVFTISNIGNVATGLWYFNYAMPDGDVQSSPIQPSLLPGQAIRYTLRLVDVPAGDVAVAVDPQNLIRELSLINNIAVVRIRGDRDIYSRPIHDWNKLADLEITDLRVGRISGSRFLAETEIYTNDVAAIRFVVRNIGGRDTGTWRFEIQNTPYFNQDVFMSTRQVSLRPGESREIIVEFTRPDDGRYNIKVELDPTNEIREETTRNNSASKTLRVLR